MLANARALEMVESVAIDIAADRTLAKARCAPRLPSVRQFGGDGFAVYAEDIGVATAHSPAKLNIQMTVSAGHVSAEALKEGAQQGFSRELPFLPMRTPSSCRKSANGTAPR